VFKGGIRKGGNRKAGAEKAGAERQDGKAGAEKAGAERREQKDGSRGTVISSRLYGNSFPFSVVLGPQSLLFR